MKRFFCTSLIILFALYAIATGGEWKSGILWPKPETVTPGENGSAPSDAIILFNGKDLSAFSGASGWKITDGVMQASGKESISTKQNFGSCQLHLEWAAPEKVVSSGQGRGNSGVFLMGKYEVQILDSYNNDTYYDGQCGSIYKQHPPLVNACKKPGQWQTYDIIFSAPTFAADGKVTRPAAMTVLHNGVLIQNNFQLLGATAWHKPPEYEPHPEKAPIQLQNHGNPVRFRNIWIRELKD